MVVVTAFVASRRNIVRMIKGQADSPRGPVASQRRLIGGVLVAAGVATLVVVLVASNGVRASSVPRSSASVSCSWPRRTHAPRGVAQAAVAVFIWSALVPTVVSGSFTGLASR